MQQAQAVTLELVLFIGLLYLTKRRNDTQFCKYIPFSSTFKSALVVDSRHSLARQITHHLKGKHQKQLMDLQIRGDSTTEGVINGVKLGHSDIFNCKYVTANHFDIDSFLSVFCCIYPKVALEFSEILIQVARIGDFREFLPDNNSQNFALKLACYLNSQERNLFYKPFEEIITTEDGEIEAIPKFKYFLLEFEHVLRNIEKYDTIWRDEYNRVLTDYYQFVQKETCEKEEFKDIDLICLMKIKQPVHYYALFAPTREFDIVVSCYENGNKNFSFYEVEIKYTTMIDLSSRTCFPRVEMLELAKYLNSLEQKRSHEIFENEFYWHADRIVDSGPILRIESKVKGNLSKAERYGHPYERPFYPSTIFYKHFKEIVVSYFSFALKTVQRKKDWEWNELHEFNQHIDWMKWRNELPSHLQ